MMEIKIVLAITPKNGMPMRVHKQDRQFQEGVGEVKGTVREIVKLP